MIVYSIFGEDKATPTERAKGQISVVQRKDGPMLSVPAASNTRFLIRIEDRDIGTIQVFLKLLMNDADSH